MEFSIEQLKSVFVYHVVETIVGADDRLSPDEVLFLQAVYPVSRMVVDGFSNDSGELTPLFGDARAVALEELPKRLSLAEKLSLVTTFLDACVVDGHLDHDEGSMLFEAATLLGVSSSDFNRHLDTLADIVGNVDLPEPEETE